MIFNKLISTRFVLELLFEWQPPNILLPAVTVVRLVYITFYFKIYRVLFIHHLRSKRLSFKTKIKVSKIMLGYFFIQPQNFITSNLKVISPSTKIEYRIKLQLIYKLKLK